MAGRVIYKKRSHLNGFLNPFNENPFTNTITTEIEITHERRPSFHAQDSVQNGGDTVGLPTDTIEQEFTPYSVNIEVAPPDKQTQPLPALLRMRTLTRNVAENETNAEAWLYARVAFLFFAALLITWVRPRSMF